MDNIEGNHRARRNTLIWLVVNACGVVAFLIVASRVGWIEPELADVPGAIGGGAIVWALMAFPIVLAFACLHIAAAFWAFLVHRKHGRWPMDKYFWVSIPMWIIACIVDSLHHGA